MNPGFPVLCDPEADRLLADRGYVVVPFLDDDEVQSLRVGYRALAPPDDDGITIDFVRDDRRVLRAVADLLAPTWQRHLDGVFVDHRPVVATFVVKHPGPGSEMVLHNEPTFVDSEVPVTYNIWIPLVAATAEPPNGALELVPGSHRLAFGLAGFDTPLLFRPYERFLRRHTITLDVPAGAAVIYDTRLLHVSGPNLTEAPRPAIAAAIAPRSTPLVHVVCGGRRSRLVYAIGEDFFLDVHPQSAAAVLAAGHRLVREAQEGWSLGPREVAAALGTTETAVPQVHLPDDLVGQVGAGSLTVRPATRGRFPTRDVEVGAADFGARLEGGAGLRVLDQDGTVATVGLARRAGHDAAPDVVPAELRSLVPWRGRSLLVVLDPGGRVALAPDQASAHAAVVYECPAVNAGIATPAGAALLDVGEEVDLEGPGPYWLWNAGPGPAWVVLNRRRR